MHKQPCVAALVAIAPAVDNGWPGLIVLLCDNCLRPFCENNDFPGLMIATSTRVCELLNIERRG